MDELPWFTRVAEYTATLPNKSKFVLGMPMYGIDWPAGGGAANPGHAARVRRHHRAGERVRGHPRMGTVAADPHFSYSTATACQHSVWYSDKQSIEVRVALAESLGLGVGLWHLGSEDQSDLGTAGARLGARLMAVAIVALGLLVMGPASTARAAAVAGGSAALSAPRRFGTRGALVRTAASDARGIPHSGVPTPRVRQAPGAAAGVRAGERARLARGPGSPRAGDRRGVPDLLRMRTRRAGAITGEDSGAITAYANAQQIAVMPRFNCQDGPTVHTDPDRSAHARTHARGPWCSIAENRGVRGREPRPGERRRRRSRRA